MKTRLETERLILQRPTSEDVQDLFVLCSKQEVNLYNPNGPDRDMSASKKTLERFIEDWERDGIGYYTVRLKSGNEYLGYIGVRKTHFSGKPLLNLAYRIEPRFHRQGYTCEACRTILAELDRESLPFPIMVLTKEENLPSFYLAQKLGFVHAPEFDHFPERGDVYLFRALP